MNNSSDQGDSTEEDIAFISRAYQATNKSNPTPSQNDSILKMAQDRIHQKAETSSKPISLRWWENQHYHGAMAASVLVVCLVYILPSSTSSIHTENPSIAEISEPQPSPIASHKLASRLEQNKKMRKTLEQQVKPMDQKIAFSSSDAIDSPEPASLALSRATTLSDDAVTSDSTEMAPSGLSSDAMARSVFADKEPAKDLITQNKAIIEDLLKLQAQTNMTHKQIINAAITAIQAQNIESEANSPMVVYLKQQNVMKRNLEQILETNTQIDIVNHYKAVLSHQEIAVFVRIAAEKNQH